MQDKCPNCGETLITRTIKKEIGLGSIDYPIAMVCPKCNWTKDLTGASDIVSKPVIAEVKKEQVKTPPPAPIRKQPEPTFGINRLITGTLAIIVLAALAWAFYPALSATQVDNVPVPTTSPVVTQTALVTPIPTSTVVPEVTPTGKSIPVFLDSHRGFIRNKDVTIKPGDEIVWRNTGIETITLVSKIGTFDSQMLAYDKEFRYIFKKTGTYDFYLKGNLNLNGTIVVEP